MRSQAYWEGRSAEREELAFQRAGQAQKELSLAYRKAYQDIEGEASKLFARYGSKNQLTVEEVEKFLSRREVEKWSADIRRQISSVTDLRRRKKLQDKLDETLAMRYRVSRLETLRQGIDVKLAKLADTEVNTDTKTFVDIIDNEYYRHIYDLQKGTGIGSALAPWTQEPPKRFCATTGAENITQSGFGTTPIHWQRALSKRSPQA